jgi:hypothetical protein
VVGAGNRQCDVMPHARLGFGRQQVAAGGLEEFQHRLRLPGWRVGKVDHDLRAGQALAPKTEQAQDS